MFVITVSQPWASLIALGQKSYLIRDGKDSYYYRGPVFIYAAKSVRMRDTGVNHFRSEPTKSILSGYGFHKYSDLPMSSIVAMADFVDVWPASMLGIIAEEDKIHGDPYTGEWMYMFENICAIEPIPIDDYVAVDKSMWAWPIPDHLKPALLHHVLMVPGF